MQRTYNREVAAEAETDKKEEGRYIYCIAETGEEVSLGPIGIEGKEVYTIPYKNICAVVHNCSAELYKSEDQKVVETWVMTHQKVVDTAWERWGGVLPFSFDTIVKAENGSSAAQSLLVWLKEEHPGFQRKMGKVRGRAEYGVQIFWDSRAVVQNLAKTSPEIRELDEEIKWKSTGLAYMYRQRLETLVRHEIETKAGEFYRDFYPRIIKHAEAVRVEKTKTTAQGLQMIMNLSCLVPRDRYMHLGEELENISKMEGFSVRFTGPWPPYSFAESV